MCNKSEGKKWLPQQYVIIVTDEQLTSLNQFGFLSEAYVIFLYKVKYLETDYLIFLDKVKHLERFISASLTPIMYMLKTLINFNNLIKLKHH